MKRIIVTLGISIISIFAMHVDASKKEDENKSRLKQGIYCTKNSTIINRHPVQEQITLSETTDDPEKDSIKCLEKPEERDSAELETEFTDPRDGKVYKVVEIGGKTWMAENLNYGERIDGRKNQKDNQITEKYCYKNDESNCDIYGGLYQWDEMMQYDSSRGIQGICPGGWHLPTDEDWKLFEGIIDGQYGYPDPEWDKESWRGADVGGKLKETANNHWKSSDKVVFNSSGFKAVPGGIRIRIGEFMCLREYALFWSSTEYDSYDAWGRGLKSSYAEVGRKFGDKSFGVSVRCVKN